MEWARSTSTGFSFNDTATTEIYTPSLHDALPISEPGGAAGPRRLRGAGGLPDARGRRGPAGRRARRDRKSTRLNSSHANISYADFCLIQKLECNACDDVTEVIITERGVCLDREIT